MDITLARVIALWGVANGVLTAVLVAYGADAFPIALHAAVTLLLELVALAAWWSVTRRPGRVAFSPAPVSGRPAFVAAAVVPFLWLGLVYDPWMMLGAVYPALILLAELARRLAPPRPEPVPVTTELPAALPRRRRRS
jgi:hypothetical protein